MTVLTKTLNDNVRGSKFPNREVILPISAPIAAEAAVAIFRGNLAPIFAVFRTSGLEKRKLIKRGPGEVFDSEKEACEELLRGRPIEVIRS